jgi:hypothetical protein
MTHIKKMRDASIIPSALALLLITASGCVPTLGGEPGAPPNDSGTPSDKNNMMPPDTEAPGEINNEPCGPEGCDAIPTPIMELDEPQNFPPTTLGDTAYQGLTLRNIGKAPLHIRTITLTGSPELRVEFTESIPRTLKYTEELQIALYYTPTAETIDRAQLLIESDDLFTPRYSMILSGRGISRCLEASTQQVDFGAVQAGAEQVRTIQLSNCAEAGKHLVSQIAIEQDGADFSLVPGSLPWEPPFDLGVGGKLSLKVRVTPSLDRPEPRGILRIDHADGSTRISLDAQVFARLGPGASASATTARTADAPSAEHSVFVDEPFTLDASASMPAPQDDTALDYTWRLLSKPADSTLTLSDKAAPKLMDLIPDQPGDYVFELRVTQGALLGCAPAQVTIHAEAP